MTRYRDHAASVVTDLVLPLPTGSAAVGPDVAVERGPVVPIEAPERRGPGWRAANGLVVLNLPEVGRASIADDGTTVVVDAPNGIADDGLGQVIASVVLTSAAVVRGGTVLHATLLRLGDRVVALTAPSGTGKSTLAVALEQRGVHIHADDGCHLDADDPGVVHSRGWAPVRLHRDSALALGRDPEDLPHMPGTAGKRVYEPTAWDEPASLRLDALLVLTREKIDAPILTPLRPAEAVPEIALALYRRDLATRLHGSGWLFEGVTRAAKAVAVQRLVVPNDLRRIDATADVVLELVS